MPKKLLNSNPEDNNVLQAVVICDNYTDALEPITFSKPSALIPLVNRPILDYTLEFLVNSQVEEVIVFISTHCDLIEDYIKNSKWSHEYSPMNIKIFPSKGCRSLGDALREIDSKGMIRNQFILINGSTVGNCPLRYYMDHFKLIEKYDKGALLAILTQEVGSGNKKYAFSENLHVISEEYSNKLLYHKKFTEGEKIQYFSNNKFPRFSTKTKSRTDLRETGVWLCSANVLPLFTDNFDYETMDDLIKGILLMDEDLLQHNLYMFKINNANYIASGNGWPNYQSISHDVVHRWTYPLFPGCFDIENEPYDLLKDNLYIQGMISIPNSTKIQETVIGKNTTIGENTLIIRCIIGHNCKIGDNVILSDTVLMENVVIDNNCNIDSCILDNNCHIGNQVILPNGCVLGPKVQIDKTKDEIPKNIKITAKPFLQHNYDNNLWKKISSQAYIVPHASEYNDSDDDSEPETFKNTTLMPLSRDNRASLIKNLKPFDEETTIEQTKEANDIELAPTDDSVLFFNEVLESLKRGVEQELACENLVLEINSSRYAYNVAADEVTFHVVRAILTLPEQTSDIQNNNYLKILNPQLNHLKPVLMKYIRNIKSMILCLEAIEDLAESTDYVLINLQKILHLLYNKDILDEQAILQWNKQLNLENTKVEEIQKQVDPLIKWLQEADEESSD